MAATAWAYMSAGSVPGGRGAAAASSVNQGATPTASATGSTVTVSWTATTLANGQAVSGYLVKRYDAATSRPDRPGRVRGHPGRPLLRGDRRPDGSWRYSVTPVLATNWQGAESAKSATVNIDATGRRRRQLPVDEDAVLTVAAAGVLTNDTDPEGDPLTAILASGVANGALTFNANGGFTYTPNPNFNGSDSFTYKANDGVRRLQHRHRSR